MAVMLFCDMRSYYSRQRSNKMQAALEAALGPNQNIGGNGRATERFVGFLTSPNFRYSILVMHQNHEIAIAILPALSPCFGSEKIDTHGVEGLHKPVAFYTEIIILSGHWHDSL
jgi:hypothetical protein